MCKWGTTEKVLVKIPADLSCTGGVKWKEEGIDKCIASLVRALQKGGVDMRGSCCGHGGCFGDIHLQDGRILLVANEDRLFRGAYSYRTRFFLKAAFENWKHSTKVKFRVRRDNFFWRLKKLLSRRDDDKHEGS